MDTLSSLVVSHKEDDPHQFDLTVASLLVGLDAEQYIDIFKKKGIGQATLTELGDEDLEMLGVDDAEIRVKIINEVKSLPVYEENDTDRSYCDAVDMGLDSKEIGQILADTSQHLYRVQLSFMASRVALRKAKTIEDCLLFRDAYASDIALQTLDQIIESLNTIEQAFDAKLKVTARKEKRKKKKMLVSAAGSTVVLVLAVLLFKNIVSLKNI